MNTEAKIERIVKLSEELVGSFKEVIRVKSDHRCIACGKLNSHYTNFCKYHYERIVRKRPRREVIYAMGAKCNICGSRKDLWIYGGKGTPISPYVQARKLSNILMKRNLRKPDVIIRHIEKRNIVCKDCARTKRSVNPVELTVEQWSFLRGYLEDVKKHPKPSESILFGTDDVAIGYAKGYEYYEIEPVE